MDETRARAWDEHWERQLNNTTRRRFALIPLQGEHIVDSARYFQAEGATRVLLPGNGCSLVPYALAHIGLKVTVLDISTVALAAVKQQGEAITEELLTRFMAVYRKIEKEEPYSFWEPDSKASLAYVRESFRAGGEVDLIHADVFKYTQELSADFIVDDCLLTLFNAEDQEKLALRYSEWLRPGGACYVQTSNYGVRRSDDGFDFSGVKQARQGLESAFANAGFFEGYPWRIEPPRIKSVGPFGKKVYEESPEPLPAQREQERRRLAGEKLVAFIHGSG